MFAEQQKNRLNCFLKEHKVCFRNPTFLRNICNVIATFMGYFLQLNWETLWQKGFIYFASVCYCTTVAGKEIVTNKICSKLSKISLWSCCRWLWQLLIIDFKIEMSTHFSNYFVLMSITLRSENDTTDVAKCWQKTKRDIKSYFSK